jgi:pilus assembly protein Flp/PilA
MRTFWKLLREEKAATAIEYALIVALIAIAAMTAIIGASDRAIAMWDLVSNNVTDNT